jgi:hypothetical protein
VSRYGFLRWFLRLVNRCFFVHRYAYFKKLTYFSTECIYSPDGEFWSMHGFLFFLLEILFITTDHFPQQHIEDTLVFSSKT